MKNKMNLIRSINAIIWICLAIVLMIYVYKVWSLNGPYTFFSFFASLIVHGGFCAWIGFLIDRAIYYYFINK